ncbi:hypothetical protein J3F84DRAFT_354194 [Trichoderma pleuroticola]
MHPKCPSETQLFSVLDEWRTNTQGKTGKRNAMLCVVSFRRWHASLFFVVFCFFVGSSFAYAGVLQCYSITHITMHEKRSIPNPAKSSHYIILIFSLQSLQMISSPELANTPH